MIKPRRLAVRGIIFKDGKLLCQRVSPHSTNRRNEFWCILGGGLEPGESLHEGLHREMIEETNITPRIGKLLFIQQYQDEEREFLEFFFHIENPEDYEMVDLEAASHGITEVEHVEFITPDDHNIMPVFLRTMDLKSYIDTPHEVPVINNFEE